MAPEETQGATENKREESNDEDQEDEATAREVAERGFKTMEINLVILLAANLDGDAVSRRWSRFSR